MILNKVINTWSKIKLYKLRYLRIKPNILSGFNVALIHSLWSLLLLFPLSSQSTEHLYPLGEHGIYYYKDTKQLVDNILPEHLDVSAIYLVYPAGKGVSMLTVNEALETDDFSMTIVKDISKPETVRTIALDKQLAQRVLKAFSTVIATIKVPSDPMDLIVIAGGTDYVFYSFPLGGFTWGKRNSEPGKVTELIEVFEIIFNQLDAESEIIIDSNFENALRNFERQ
ncbi:hypothetical protein N476_18050 [Pseudoalteromonas luteoviolacea H33]|uniref:Uncharacterized protein n=1 Tax=Pseudoalteromonas luteoviolacea H33 TaxID=1365251 RepID=A0A167E268_9GAMM|nr:hypothetical protein N476_18050 [Pseudoalteromonas luteoviolacea H33]KZN74823.1 hypothetical protein N477_21465 [Pseudoalteromonas luteoviolacea H33-S]